MGHIRQEVVPNQEGRRALRVHEWSRLYGVPKKTVYAHIARGHLPVIRVGRTVLIPVNALEGKQSQK